VFIIIVIDVVAVEFHFSFLSSMLISPTPGKRAQQTPGAPAVRCLGWLMSLKI